MAEEVKEYLDLEGLTEYDKKAKELFQDLTIQDVEEAFNELDESDPSYSAFYDVIAKAKEATQNADSKAQAAVTATNNANTATTKADEATARANKAAEKLETVNDMTTGVNLLRQTRDFKIGDDAVYPGSSSYVSNGFYLPSDWTVTKDEDGFTVISCTRSGLTADAAAVSHCSVVPCKKGDVFTFSVDFMSEDVKGVDSPSIVSALVMGKSAPGTLESFDISIESIDAKDGEWKRIQRVMNVTAEGAAYLIVRLRLGRNGNVNFRKPAASYGRISDLLYSVSPFDMALEPVNDITVESNLVPYSKDLPESIENIPGTDNRPINGWHLSSSERQVGDDGFTYMHLTTQVGKDTCIRNIPLNNTYTLFFDFMCEGASGLTNKNIVNIYVLDTKLNATLWRIESINLSAFGVSEVKDGKWYHLSYTFTIPQLTTNDWFLIYRFTYNHTTSGTSVNFKKPGIYPGRIENPVWNANPSDYVSSKGSIPRLSGITKLENNTDLDTITTYGMYCTPLDVDAQTMTNVPDGMRTGFVLEVSDPQGCGNVRARQKLTTWTEGAVEYTRLMNADKTWTAWRQTYGNTTIRPIAGGGTGKNTARGASNAILGDMRDLDNAASEGSYFVFFDTGHSDLQGAVAKRSASLVWEWISYKIEQTYNVTKK